jgi:hypothetical protein
MEYTLGEVHLPPSLCKNRVMTPQENVNHSTPLLFLLIFMHSQMNKTSRRQVLGRTGFSFDYYM